MEQKNQLIYWTILVLFFFGAIDLIIWANLNVFKEYSAENNIITPNYNKENQQNNNLVIQVQWEENLIKQPSEDRAFDNYLAGKIINGEFSGQNIYLEIEQSIGSAFRHYVLKDGNKFYLDGYYNEDEKNKNFIIKGISDLPEEIKFSDSAYILERGYISELFNNLKLTKKLFTNSIGDFYLAEDGCLAVELPDHTGINYDFKLPFINDENGELNITLITGQKYVDEYEFNKILGCGGFCRPLNNIDIIKPEESLIAVGKTDGGEIFYKFTNQQADRLRALYDDKNTVAYYDNSDNQYKTLNNNKYTYGQFIDFYPLLYWKDQLGRWIEFKNKKFASAAEMCKPAIYLYPREKIDLNIKVAPNGGFTKTIPSYNNGWQVTAYPSGKIIESISKQAYSYLYWSGIAINYPVPNEGWVVKKDELNAFFDNKLGAMGLNSVEIKDFKNYWLEQLNGKPYYQISFLFNGAVDRLAPLSFSLKPDKIFRVILVAKGLDKSKNIIEQKLSFLGERDGFIVVEWGGILLK